MARAELSPEALRNRLLRRADWRFLAGTPAPARSLCSASPLLTQATGLISGRVAQLPAEAAMNCDLAVLSHPDQSALRSAWGALRPGGVCYSEWHSALAGGLPGVRRHLEAAGFQYSAAYWPWPLPERASPAFWLPLDAPEALQYFLKNRPQTLSLGRRLWNKALRAAWQVGWRSHLLAPACVVASKPASDGAGQVDLLEALRSRWRDSGLGATPHRLSWLLLTGGQSYLNKVVALVFADGIPIPRLIVKLPRAPEATPALMREAANLQAIPGQLPGIPRALFLDDWCGQKVLGETFLTGQPLYQRLRRETYRALAFKVTDWLANLTENAPAVARSAWQDGLVEAALVDFERSFGVTVAPELMALTRARLAGLPDLPPVCEQRDFSPWNVLITPDDNLAVLDWESAEPRGLPALDLIYCLTYLAFFVEGVMSSRRFREAYRRTLDPASLTGQITAECLQRYATRLSLEPAVFHPLRLLTWLIHTRSDYRRFEGQAQGRPSPAALRGSLFRELWQEELLQGNQ